MSYLDDFGDGSLDGKFTKKIYYSIKDGQNVYRILPEKSVHAKEKKMWATYHAVHYGYKNSEGSSKPFSSSLVRNYNTKMIDVGDAALEKIDTLKAELEKAKLAKNAPLVERLNKLVGGQKPQFNLDKKFYMYAINEAGQLGLLKLGYRAKQSLDQLLKSLKNEGTNPLSAKDGRFLVFERSGSGRDTVTSVRVKKEKVNVSGMGVMEKDVTHTLSQELATELKAADELDALYAKPTADQIARIVKEGATAVDEILGAGKGKKETKSALPPVDAEEASDDVFEEKTSVTAQTTAPVTTHVVTPKVVAPKTITQVLAEQSEEDFLKSMGV